MQIEKEKPFYLLPEGSGKFIRGKRYDLDVRAKEVAMAAGISPPLLSLIETGIKPITERTRQGISYSLGISPSEWEQFEQGDSSLTSLRREIIAIGASQHRILQEIALVQEELTALGDQVVAIGKDVADISRRPK